VSSSALPSSSVVALSSMVKIGLNGVTSLMESTETFSGFEETCKDFLSDLFRFTSPPISGLSCLVRGQKLVGVNRNRLLNTKTIEKETLDGVDHFRSDNVRKLQSTESFSLEIDIIVTGSFVRTDFFVTKNDVPFDDYLDSFFEVQGETFVDGLQQLARENLLPYFADITEVGTIDQLEETTLTEANNPESLGADVNRGPVVAAAVGGCVALVLFVAAVGFVFRNSRGTQKKRKRQDHEKLFSSQIKGSKSDDAESVVSAPMIYGGSDAGGSRDLDSQSYAYSLEHGIESIGGSSSLVSFSMSMKSLEDYNEPKSPAKNNILSSRSIQSQVVLSPESVEANLLPQELANTDYKEETSNNVGMIHNSMAASGTTKARASDNLTTQQKNSSKLISSILMGKSVDDQFSDGAAPPVGKSPSQKSDSDLDEFVLYETVSDILGSQSLHDDFSKSAPTKEGTGLVQRECYAPPGKLGVIIDTTSNGPIVHEVKPGSALEGVLFSGDRIIAVDDIDTRSKTAAEVTNIMASKVNVARKISVLGVPSDASI